MGDLVSVVSGTGTAIAKEQISGIEQVLVAAGNGTDGIQNKGRDVKQFFVFLHRAGKMLPSCNADAAARRNACLLQQSAQGLVSAVGLVGQ